VMLVEASDPLVSPLFPMGDRDGQGEKRMSVCPPLWSYRKRRIPRRGFCPSLCLCKKRQNPYRDGQTDIHNLRDVRLSVPGFGFHRNAYMPLTYVARPGQSRGHGMDRIQARMAEARI